MPCSIFASIEDNFNAYWREKMLEASMRGRRGKAEAGIIPGQGPVPYGYSKEGKHREMHLVIVEEQAQIIRDIFHWFVIDDMGAFDIAKRLTALAIPTPGGANHPNRKAGLCDWHGNMITKILRKEVYAGTFHAYKYYSPKGVKTCRLRPRSEWVPIPVPAIVERDVWEAAQNKLDELRRKYVKPPKHEYLMSRRIKCACGKYGSARPHTVGNKTYLYYDCNAAFKNTREYQCSLPSFRADQVDAVVWEWLHALLLDPQAMIAGYKASQQTYEQQNERVYEQIAVIDRHIETQQQKLAQVLDLYLEGDFTKAVLEHKRAELEAQLAALRDERQALVDRIAQTTITDEHIVSITELAAFVRDELDNADFALRRQLVEALNIWCTLAVEDGEKVVYVHWYARTDRLCTTSEGARALACYICR